MLIKKILKTNKIVCFASTIPLDELLTVEIILTTKLLGELYGKTCSDTIIGT